jgi:hypothetical protein
LPDISNKGLEFLWQVAMESNGQCDILIVNRAANGFQGAISSQNMETRLHYADKLAENIKQNKMGYLAVKLLTGILKSKEKFDHPEIQTVEDFINYLEKKHDLLKAVSDNFKFYMSKVKEEVAKHDKVSDFEGKVIMDLFMHGD